MASNNIFKLTIMKKEKRKNDQREDIKIDDYTPGNGSGASNNVGNKRVVKDNTKLIAALVLLVVMVLMAILRAHPVASIVTAGTIGMLVYLIYKERK